MRSSDEKRILGLWPKYEDGGYVMPGDVAVANSGAKKGRAFTVLSVRVNTVGVCLTDCDGSYWNYKAGDRRVKRPEPKVLDADGVEIKVGDTVYDPVSVSELADLIEPEPERTCRVVTDKNAVSQTQEVHTKHCSECSYVFGREQHRQLLPGLDEEFVLHAVQIPDYCPNCGAKVVEK